MVSPAETRGTPRPAREAAADMVDASGWDRRANCRAGPVVSPALRVAISDEAGLPSTARPAVTDVESRLGVDKRKRLMPKSTPPYSPCMDEHGTITWSSSTWTQAFSRTCHSWGTSMQHAAAEAFSSARPNQASPRSAPDSMRYFAMMEAFATSRNWNTTLFLSAMRSKLSVKASAYTTHGWSGREIRASSSPLAVRTCSRASTPIRRCGIRTWSSDAWTSAFRTTNHSRALHSDSGPSSSDSSKALLMPRTGWSYSPKDSSLR
mmetsp:Transcript_52421/g.159327  ORF Transcript_52421/g.159327 Transcript_52421/m.159327 type:complete len:264 (-) Transcript_52421:557-1348(-)